MPLLDIWRAARHTVLGMNLEAVVRMAGDGQLRDGNETSNELRTFLREVEAEKLEEYAKYCLETAFTNSGQVLQDIINEIGRRLGFTVENGRYQGVRNDIGYDGIWFSNHDSLVIEVKTTNAYTINLDVIARYCERLVETGRVPRDTPVLIVIGRNDTESLEAQVRGSKHAWSMRIIGVEALIKLMYVNLTTSSELVLGKIHKVLRPLEYTRVDEIVDIVFTTAEDKDSEVKELEVVGDESVSTEDRQLNRTDQETIRQLKSQIVSSLSSKLGKQLQKRRHSMYADIDDEVRAVLAVSKRYERAEKYYWYAYHDQPQRKYLNEVNNGYMVFGLTDKKLAFAVPAQVLEKVWDDMYSSVKASGMEYKHVYIYDTGEDFVLRTRSGVEISLSSYCFDVS